MKLIQKKKRRRVNKNGDGPSIFRFKAPLIAHPEKRKNGSLDLLIPKPVSKKLPLSGTTVEGTINGHPFRGLVQPAASGSHLLRVNDAMRKGAAADAGDTVELVILEPDLAPTPPDDLWAAISASRAAKTLWRDLTPIGQCDWIRWVDGAKQRETRSRRIKIAIEKLSSGTRAPCCFNTYEYMLRHLYNNGFPKNSYLR